MTQPIHAYPEEGITLIRSTHPYGFRSGQWATYWGTVTTRGRECYFVRFPDGETDQWPIADGQAGYEFAQPDLADSEV